MPQKLRNDVGLPVRPFLYTLDQLAGLLSISLDTIKDSYVHFEQSDPGRCPPGKLKAINIAPEGERAEWRVSEQQLIFWMRRKGFRYYETGWTK